MLDLDALITQQALREAISDGEVATAKQRHQLILDYIQVKHLLLVSAAGSSVAETRRGLGQRDGTVCLFREVLIDKMSSEFLRIELLMRFNQNEAAAAGGGAASR